MNPIKTMVVAIRVLAVRPWLWPTALRQLRNFAPDGWWRRAPFLPIPDRALLEFRVPPSTATRTMPLTPTICSLGSSGVAPRRAGWRDRSVPRRARHRRRRHASRLPSPETPHPTLVVGEVTAPALVLGSTQPDTHADPARAVAGGYEIVRRRSGEVRCGSLLALKCGSMCGFPPVTRGGTTTSPEPQCRSARRGAQRSRFSVSVTASTFTTGGSSPGRGRRSSASPASVRARSSTVMGGSGSVSASAGPATGFGCRRWPIAGGHPPTPSMVSSVTRDPMPPSPTLSGRSTAPTCLLR